MSDIGLIFPHQLIEHHELLTTCDTIYLVEEFLFFNQYPFHKQKLVFHRASMKAYAVHLEQLGISVIYISSQAAASDVRKLIPKIAQNKSVDTLHYIDPTDFWLSQRITNTGKSSGLELKEYENPTFLTTREELTKFFRSDKKSFFQTTFYKQQRKRLNILLDHDENPVGGKWSFDAENRKKYPKGKTPPHIHFPDQNAFYEEAVAYVEQHFSNNYGTVSSNPIYPTTYQEAQSWLKQFLDFRFHHFGHYEDAIVKEETFLHHSVLSPLLNVGLLSPQDVLEQSLDFAASENIPINSTEGFVRQIIGWREFIRGMYECKGVASRTENFWGFTRKIPKSFYTGETGIAPVDETIKRVLKTGYCHHIERLMILGNFMVLCEFDPDEVYQWFMELFIDAYDWVMVPNVYGMSQFADGGLFATKPYISGSNYINKMSNYPKGDWQKTWDGLFWRFIHVHEEFFSENPRLSMMVHTYHRKSEEKQSEHLKDAEAFLNSL